MKARMGVTQLFTKTLQRLLDLEIPQFLPQRADEVKWRKMSAVGL
jgi:hypothetical protein